jgi:hypothetical protein
MAKSPPNANRLSTIHNSAAGTGNGKARTSRIVYCLTESFYFKLNFIDKGSLVLLLKEHFKTFCEAFKFVVEFYLKLKLILHIITYLTYIYMFGN